MYNTKNAIFRFQILLSEQKCLTSRSRNLRNLSADSIYSCRGIGLEATVLFLREGASVLMADISIPALQAAIAKINTIIPTHDGRLDHIHCDVSRESDVAAMVAHVDSWGGVVSSSYFLHIESIENQSVQLRSLVLPHLKINQTSKIQTLT